LKLNIVSLAPIVAAAVLCVLFGPGAPAAAQMPPAPVVVAEVQQRELAAGATFVGTVTASRTSMVGSPVEGRVVELLVEEGDEVKQNDPLARLRTRQLEIQLAAAKAEFSLRSWELAELAESLPEQIKQAQHRVLASQALKDFTASRLKRTKTLYDRKATSEDDLQEVSSAADGAEQKYLENTSAWKLAVATREEKLAQAQARLVAQQEEVNRLQDEIDEHTIRSPFDGYVTEEHTEIGQWIAKGATVVEVVELKSIDVEVSVLESYAPRLRLGMPAQVTIGDLPGQPTGGESRSRWWTAPVSAILPKADDRSRTFPIKVRLDNPIGPGGPTFKAGMSASVTLQVGTTAKVLLVPKDALVLGGRVPMVYVATPMPKQPAPEGGPPAGGPPPGGPPAGPSPDSISSAVPVELGMAVDGLVEVRGDLKPRQRVVVEGNERLFPGRPLIVVEQQPPAFEP